MNNKRSSDRMQLISIPEARAQNEGGSGSNWASATMSEFARFTYRRRMLMIGDWRQIASFCTAPTGTNQHPGRPTSMIRFNRIADQEIGTADDDAKLNYRGFGVRTARFKNATRRKTSGDDVRG